MPTKLRFFQEFGKLSGIFRISIAAFLVVTAFGIFDFILPYFTEDITENMFMIGLTVSMVYIASFFMEVPIGLLVDRFGRKSVMMISLLLLAVMGGIYFFVSNIALLIILEFIFGMIAVAFWIPSAVLVRDYSPKREFAASQGIYFTFMQGGWVIGPIIAGFIADRYEPKFSFLIFSLFVIIGVIYSRIILTKKSPKRMSAFKKEETRLFNLLKSFKGYVKLHKHALPLYLLSMFVNIWIGVEWVFVQIASSNIFHFSDMLVGLLFAGMMLVEGLLYYISGRIMDKVGKRFILITGFLLLTFSTLYASLSIYSSFFVFFLLLGAGAIAWIIPGTEAIATELIPIKKRGEMTGVFDSSKDMGLILGPLIGGAVAQLTGNPMTPFFFVALIGTAGVFVILLKFWK